MLLLIVPGCVYGDVFLGGKDEWNETRAAGENNLQNKTRV